MTTTNNSTDAAGIASASTYVNNLLLSRGLLRDGKPIQFERLCLPCRHDRRRLEGGKDRKEDDDGPEASKVTTQLLNLIHDLVLGQDRAQSTNSALSTTLTGLRTDLNSSAATISRLTSSNSTLERQAASAQSSLTSAVSAQRAAEASARQLRDKLARTEKVVGEVKTMCANDIRKRDVQIAKLKGFLSDRQRGATGGASNSKTMVGPSCTISGVMPRRNGRGSALSTQSGRTSTPVEQKASINVQDAGYTLQQETNEFLTQLSQSLSDENDALIALIRSTLDTLRDVQNKPAEDGIVNHSSSVRGLTHNDSGISIPPVDHPTYATNLAPPSIESLANELSSHMKNLRLILSNPSFAPIEEVHVREEEIQRLREGWEKMEMRWKEAVGMMMVWRQRMLGDEEEADGKDRSPEKKRWQEEMDELTRGLDEVTMTMEGLDRRRKARASFGTTREEESIVDNVGESVLESSQVNGGDEEGDYEESSLAPDESVLRRSIPNDGVHELPEEDDTTTLPSQQSAVSPSSQTDHSSTSTTAESLDIPPIPSRSPLRTSDTAARARSHSRNRNTNTVVPPPSAMKSRRSTQDMNFSRKVSFKHLQSPSIINQSAMAQDDYDELG